MTHYQRVTDRQIDTSPHIVTLRSSIAERDKKKQNGGELANVVPLLPCWLNAVKL